MRRSRVAVGSLARGLGGLSPRVVLFAASVAAAFLLLACGSDNDAPNLGQPNQTGRELTEQFIRLIQQKDVNGLQSFLSDAFILQRAEGQHYTKSEYLTRLPEIGQYTISDVQARQDGNALVVRWSFTVQQVIEGQPYRTDPAPRISTFIWADGRWQMTSHANFNTPQ